MTKARMGAGLVAGCLLLWSGALSAWAKPNAADILRYRPRQQGVAYSTPSEQEQALCTVELVTDKNGGSGWVVRDPRGRTLRRFFDTNGDKHIDIWSYYLDGVEVYREIDSTFENKGPDQYRWLNSGGMKWGLDPNRDGKIKTWKAISAEEVSQEIVQAVVTQDFARLQALFLTPAEMQDLGLPAAEASRIQELQKQADAKFQRTLKQVALNDKTHWLHLETAPPQCLPADTLGSRQDVIKYPRGTILCETGGKNDWLQTGEMILVGSAWRLVDAPTPGDGGDAAGPVDPALQALLDQLRKYDAGAPKAIEGGVAGANTAVVRYNLGRADLLEQIVAKVKPEEREQWIRQVADCLSAAAQNSPESDKVAYQRLMRLEEQIVRAMPRTPLAAYITFREMQAENAARLANPKDVNKAQEQWQERLTRFVGEYPNAEDAPEALMQLGMVSEFVSKEGQAKKWYGQLVKDFPDHPLATKARGALRRLELEGKPLELAGTQLDGGPFNIDQLRGKVVVVYYWASWNKDRSVGDFATLKLLLDTYGSKGLALVSVNLDQSPQEATAFLQRSPAPGFHLYQPGGLDSPLATQYGVLVLPNLFLVDREGKVISRTVQQVSGLEDELKKILK